MLQALDMRTVLFEGALVCFTIAGIMGYYARARKTYPGFHYWTAGFLGIGTGALLIVLRGFLPDFLSIVVANMLVAAMPFLLSLGLAIFLGIQWKYRSFYVVILALLFLFLIITTYVFPSLSLRTSCFSLVFLLLFLESLRIAKKYLPLMLGSQNWLFLIMLVLCIVPTAFRIASALLEGHRFTFLNHTGHLQSATILMTILSMVGIMASLIMLNAQRMEIELKEATRKIERLANQDGLTKLFNRGYFDKILDQEFKRLQRTCQPISLIMADIDFFKKYNDTYGHVAGDNCIRAIADVFKASGKRISDIAARYGGEEFVLLLPNTDLDGANTVARAICRHVDEKAIVHATSNVAKTVTLSIGVASLIPCLDTDPDVLLKLADKALYESKLQGRNRIRSHFANLLAH